MGILAYLFLTAFLICLRVYAVLLATRTAKPSRRLGRSDKCSFAVFLGSGGHTSEALSLLSALDFDRYIPRTYIISEGDAFSMQKALDLEATKASGALGTSSSSSQSEPPFSIVVIPRARRVHQSLLTTPFSAALSLASSIWHITVAPMLYGPPCPEVLLLNGPGTCVVLCIAVYVNRILALKSPALIYVESFARVRHLSLTGGFLRQLADRFIVQWPELVGDGKRGEYHGWLV